MPAVQIPLWVTYSLAVIAILGPIGGALIGGKITAARDDRRWEREAARENLRWHREEHRVRTDREYDHGKDWRGRRLDLYGELLATARDGLGELNAARALLREEIANEDRTQIVESFTRKQLLSLASLKSSLGRVSLIGSPEVESAANNVCSALITCRLAMSVNGLADPHFGELVNDVKSALDALVEVMRADLGVQAVSPDDAERVLIKEQPSGSTS